MAGIFQYATRLISETESLFTSVERLLEYPNGVEKEAPAELPWPGQAGNSSGSGSGSGSGDEEGTAVAADAIVVSVDGGGEGGEGEGKEGEAAWPWNGAISIENFSARYRPGLPLVLKGLELDIPGGTFYIYIYILLYIYTVTY